MSDSKDRWAKNDSAAGGASASGLSVALPWEQRPLLLEELEQRLLAVLELLQHRLDAREHVPAEDDAVVSERGPCPPMTNNELRLHSPHVGEGLDGLVPGDLAHGPDKLLVHLLEPGLDRVLQGRAGHVSLGRLLEELGRHSSGSQSGVA